MMYVVLLMSIVFFVGVLGVAYNPSPCYGTLFLILASGVGCGVVAEIGDVFSAFILFLIYLGGMLVVFVFSLSFSSDVYPSVLSSSAGGVFGFWCVSLLFVCAMFMTTGLPVGFEGFSFWGIFDSGYFGVPLLYSLGCGFLLIIGFGLLLTLYVVFELVHLVSFGCLKIM